MKTKIKRGYCYITTDKSTFTGKDAKGKADKHQKHLMMEGLKDEMTEEARKILNVPPFIPEKGVDENEISCEEEAFMEYIEKNVDTDMEYFDEFVDYFVDMVLVNPIGIEKLAGVIKDKFEQLKV